MSTKQYELAWLSAKLLSTEQDKTKTLKGEDLGFIYLTNL